MGPHLCPHRSALHPGGLLFLLLLADPALPTGRHPPVVLGEARVQSWIGSLMRGEGQGAGVRGNVFPVCICSSTRWRSDCLVTHLGRSVHLRPYWSRVWSTSLSPSPVEYGGK